MAQEMLFKRIMLLMIFVGAGILLWSFIPFEFISERAVPALQSYVRANNTLAFVLFIVLAALSVLLGPFSSVFLVPPAIVVWGSALTLFLLLAGWLIGGILAYAIGRYVGHAVVARLISPEKIDTWSLYVSRRATFTLALAFRLALPAETGYIFGLVRYEFWRYTAIIFLAEIPFALAAVYASDAILAQNGPLFFGAIIAIAILIAGAGYVVRARTRG